MVKGILKTIYVALKGTIISGSRCAVIISISVCLGNITTVLGQDNTKIIHDIPATAEGEQLGQSVAGLGDVNGDGLSDFVIGAHSATNPAGKVSAGCARVYSGSDGSVIHTFWGDNTDDRLGFSVSGTGDVDGDGVPDVVVGIPWSDTNGVDAGAVRVFSGKDGTLVREFLGNRSYQHFGISVAGAGDLNKDQLQEIVVGAPGASDGVLSNTGAVIVFSVKEGKELWTKYGSQSDEGLGEAVAGAGDVNKDGHDDVIAGTPQSNDKGYGSGSATVFSGQDGKILNRSTGSHEYERFDNSVAGMGDLNGDGYDDFAVGAPGAARNGEDEVGSVTVFSGATFGILATLYGNNPFENFGWSLASAGDMNGDSVGDIIVGIGTPQGEARIFSGSNRALLYSLPGRTNSDDRFGFSIGGAGDVNGDGYADVIIGAPQSNTAGDWSGRAVVIGDSCPDDSAKAEPGMCGCGMADTDTDKDGTLDCNDRCSSDANKIEPGQCGCGVADADTDKDGTADCNDRCSSDANKIEPGQCGCGVADADTDKDGTADCNDLCPNDPSKIDGCDGTGIDDATPTPAPTPTATPNLLPAPKVKAGRGSVQIWVVQKFNSKDRVTFSITGPKSRKVRGKRVAGSKKGTTKFQANLSKLPKGTYQASWEVLWLGTTLQRSSPTTFRVK